MKFSAFRFSWLAKKRIKKVQIHDGQITYTNLAHGVKYYLQFLLNSKDSWRRIIKLTQGKQWKNCTTKIHDFTVSRYLRHFEFWQLNCWIMSSFYIINVCRYLMLLNFVLETWNLQVFTWVTPVEFSTVQGLVLSDVVQSILEGTQYLGYL